MSPSFLVGTALVVVAQVGYAALFRVVSRVRRCRAAGATCWNCGYDAKHRSECDSERCPECGESLRGRPRVVRRRTLALQAVALGVAAAGCTALAVLCLTGRFVTLLPDVVVVAVCAETTEEAFWDEAWRRVIHGTMTPAVADALADTIWKRLLSPSGSPTASDLTISVLFDASMTAAHAPDAPSHNILSAVRDSLLSADLETTILPALSQRRDQGSNEVTRTLLEGLLPDRLEDARVVLRYSAASAVVNGQDLSWLQSDMAKLHDARGGSGMEMYLWLGEVSSPGVREALVSVLSSEQSRHAQSVACVEYTRALSMCESPEEYATVLALLPLFVVSLDGCPEVASDAPSSLFKGRSWDDILTTLLETHY